MTKARLALAGLPSLLLLSFFWLVPSQLAQPVVSQDVLWVATIARLFKVDSNNGDVLLNPADTKNLLRLAADEARETFWAYGNGTLSSFDSAGQLILTVTVPHPSSATTHLALAVDANDDGVWLGVEKNLHHFNGQGTLLQTLDLPGPIQDLSLDLAGGRLWVATPSTVMAIDGSGHTVANLNLPQNPNVQAIAVDRSSGALWVALQNALELYSPAAVLIAQRSFKGIVRLSDDGDHGVWASGAGRLVRFNAAQQIIVDASPLNNTTRHGSGSDDEECGTDNQKEDGGRSGSHQAAHAKARDNVKSDSSGEHCFTAMISDRGDQSVWIARNKNLAHIGATGTLLLSVSLPSNVNDLSLLGNANHTPVGRSDSALTGQNTPIKITVLGNDSDPDGDSIAITGTTQGSHGTVSNDKTTVTYTPDAGFHGFDDFAYTIGDGRGGSATANVAITVDQAPIVDAGADQTITLPASASLNGDVTDDGLPDPPAKITISWSKVSGPGSVTFSEPAAARTTAAFSQGGVYVLRLSANDGFQSSIDDVQITVNAVVAVNQAPVANDGTLTDDEDAPLGITLHGSDVDSQSLSFAIVSGPSRGSLGPLTVSCTIQGAGSTCTAAATYTPNGNYNRADSFTFKVNDGSLDSNVATVGITVNAVDDAPAAVDASATTNEDTAVPVALSASDIDSQSLNFTIVSGPDHGSLALNGGPMTCAAVQNDTGTPGAGCTAVVSYAPAANYNGADSFTFQVNDGSLDSNTATAQITVNPVNDASAAVDDAYSGIENTVLDVAAPGVLGNDNDVDDARSTLTAVLVAGPAHAANFALNADGSFSYTPQANFGGVDIFTYQAQDPHGTLSNAATATITINAVNHAPVAANDFYNTDAGKTLSLFAPGVLGNDNDSDTPAANLTAILVDGPLHAANFTLNADGSFSYTPEANFTGSDSFTYRANDGVSDSNVAMATIAVRAANSAPVAANDFYHTAENTPLNVAAAGVLGNDNGTGASNPTTILIDGPAHAASFTLNADGSFSYTPEANFTGADTFTYKATGGGSDSDVAMATIAVHAASGAPVAENDTYGTDKNTSVVIAAPGVLGNDSDTDTAATSLTLALVAGPSHAANFQLNADGSFDFLPEQDFTGVDSFAYRVFDGAQHSNVAMVSITVNAAQNRSPIAVDDAATAGQSTPLTVNVLANDSDPDGDPLTISAVTQGSNGTVVNNGKTVTYTPNANFIGSDGFTYTITDGRGGSASAAATIDVRRNADLRISFFNPPTAPPVGSGVTFFIQVDNDGPAATNGVTARFQIPAGYTFTSGGPQVGTYDGATGNWDIGSLVSGGLARLILAATVNPTGPYDLTATITGSSEPDPNPANNTATATVTPNTNADLNISFFNPATNPPVGSSVTFFIEVRNNGPASATGVTARFQIPPGYTFTSGGPQVGTYDSATGNWNIGSLVSGGLARLILAAAVNATGPYDLTTTITKSSAPDPNPADNTATVTVTPNANADLSISFFNPPSGTLTVGSTAGFFVEVRNNGPAITAGVTVRFQLPAGYTFSSGGPQVGTYDVVTGNWNIGSMSLGSLARLILSATVNATGPLGLTAAITGSSAPDPDLTNNTATAAPANRPPVANAGAHQDVGVGATVLLDGSLSSDADGDALSFQWTLFSRPVNSVALLSNSNKVTPSFVPDLPGTFTAQLRVTDSKGAASSATNVTISASILDFAPTITSKPITIGAVGQPYLYDVQASDPDAGEVLTYSLTTAPAGMTIDATTGVIQWTPTGGQGGQEPVTVRVQDQHGLFATQDFKVQVSSAANHAPVAVDDAYQARLGEALSIAAPGVLANDSDADGNKLTATLLTQPTNGALAFNPDGSFVYTPHTLQPGEFVQADDVDLIRAIPGTTFNMNGDPGVVGPPCDRTFCAFDDNPSTMASTSGLNPATFEVVFPQDVTVNQVRVMAGRHPLANRPTSGIFRLLAADGAVLYDSGPVELPLPDRDATLVLPGLAHVRRVQFSPLTGEQSPFGINLAEVKVIGSALIRRQRIVEPNLVQLLPATVQAGSFVAFNVPESIVDDNAGTNWYSAGNPGDFIEVTFPLDVTVTELQAVGPTARPDGFGTSLGISCSGTFTVHAADGGTLFDSGVVNTPSGNLGGTFVLPLPSLSGVRRIRYTANNCPGSNFPAGFSEWRVLGSAPVTTPAFQLTKKFQVLLGREVHSTPVVANLTDDNGDGRIDARDIPDIVVPVESIGNQLTGEIKVLSGDDGRELYTIGSGLVSPWSEVAVGDIDGDGVLEIIAVHSDGNHLIAFDLAGGTLQGDLTQLLRPVTVNVSSSSSQFLPAGGVDDRLDTIWMTANGDAANLGTHPFFEVELRQDVTVTQVQIFGNRGFPGDNFKFRAGFFQLFASNGSVLFDSGVIALPLPDRDFTLTVPNVAGVRRVRFTGTDDGGSSVGLTEFRVFGSATIATGTPRVKWISDPNPMPNFFIGNSALVGGAVSIANLDGGPRPHIIVGASVFDADGRLLGDGRALGGTTGGTGLRSAISAIVDLDLDGIPEIVAGPSAYRLVNGRLEIVWQRKDLPDGYVAVGNFDDDPFPEIVIVADGKIYMLNHDGTDAEVWDPPTHGPVTTPGAPEGAAGPANGQSGAPLIVDVDGDGIPEIGIAKAANYLLYNRDGSLRWKAAISDRSSHSTGSVAFDFDGDGTVEIVYRDEKFLRIFRGADGVLLAEVPVQSATWAEQPVVVDVDNDGHADIVVTSDLSGGLAGDTGVLVFRDVANKWTRTRRIWNQHSYHITNVNEDGTIPRVETPNWLVPGLNNFRVNAFIPGESPDQADSFTYKASDGTLDSNEATVRITVATPNSAPRITSAAVTTAAVGVPYIYAALASDPDAGDVLTFSLPTKPAGMSIDSNSGLIQWTPASNQLGSHDAVLKVQDARGAFALQSYTIQVLDPATVPDVTGQSQANAQANIKAAGFVPGSITNQNSPTIAAGTVISQNPSGGTLAAPGSAISLVISIGPPPPGVVPNLVGETQSRAQSDITASGFSVGTITGQNSTTINLGIIISQNPAAGTILPAGSAVNLLVSLGPPPGNIDQDRDGFTPNQGDCDDANASIHPGAFDIPNDGIDQNCNGRDSVAGDTTPPTVGLAAPAEQTVIALPTDIIGTADDVNFLRYKLEVARVNDTNFAVIGGGTTPVVNGTLGRLDPSLLEDGMYRVRLTTEDVNGQISLDERVYSVRSANTAHTRLAFVDLTVPLAGVPISVVRAYDSRVKTQRDFGVGWSLKVRQGSYENNREPGQGWQILPSGGPLPLPCRTINESLFHATQIWLSDREFYTFKLGLVNAATVVGGCVAEARFDFVDGPTGGAKLEIVGNKEVIYTSGGDVRDFSGGEDTGLIYNPQVVRLTTKDRRIIELDRNDGITRIEDANGNSLVFTAGGIVHSSGESISFNRDAQGRITRITDPLDNALNYAYDANGNLITFTSRTGDVISHTYDGNHNLLAIQNASGDFLFRAEYDSEGHLVGTRDANGERVGIVYDFANAQNTITDRLGQSSVYKYDERGNITTESDALGHITSMTFGPFDTLLSTIDTLGNITTFTYDDQGNLLTRNDPLGHVSSYTYNENGQVLTATDALGHTTTNTYDARGNLVSTTDPMGNVWRNEYDSQGNVLRRIDPAGNISRFEYNDSGWLIRQTGFCGEETQYVYDAAGQRVQTIQIRILPGTVEEIVTRYEYDASGRQIRIIYNDGFSARTEYDAGGNVGTSIDKLGGRTSYTYTPRGLLAQTAFRDGTTEQRTYDAEGRLATSTNRNGNVTTNIYDAVGQQIQTRYPDSATETTTYDELGRVIAEIDPLGHATTYTYDAAGRRTSATDAAGQKTSYNYDAVGNVVSMQHPDGQVYSFEYDANNRRIKTIYPDGTFELMTYDFASRTTSKTDQAGRITRFNYDACGRLQSVVDALGQLTSYTYDTLGNRISQSDPNGHVTRWEYDAFRRVTKRTLPLGMFETFVYDPAGNLTRKTDFNGKTTSYTYDADDRLLSKTYPDFSSVEFTYRPGGQRATMIDSRGVTSYLYDAIDRVTQVIQPDGTAISYTYDAADNRTSITVPSGMTRFAYDAVDRLTNVTEPNGAVTSYSYDTVGNLVHMSFPNNTQSDHTYDSLNRLIAVENKRADNTLLSGFTYSLGPAGNRLQANEQGGRTVSYAYDALYRLTGETFTDPARGNRAISYTYDAAGNRLVKNDSATGVTTYVYDTNDRLLSENGRSYSYDANGNLLAQPDGTTYQYDAENRLIQAQTPAGSVQYAYDADGVRVQSLAAGAATNYLVDKNRRYAQVLEERNGAGALLASNIFGYGLIRRQQGAAGAYYLYDGQRSVRQLTDLNGAVTDIYTYEGFGSLLDHTGIASNPYQFGGEEFDAHLGQYYLRARYYQPALGRFLTVDPAAAIPAEPRTLNRYVYAWNDPINQQDPSGEQTSLAEAMISVAINGILAQLPEQGIAVEIPELHIDFSEVEGWQDTNQPQRYPNTSDILHTAFETVRGDFSRYNVKVLRWGETAKQAGLVKPKLKDKLVSVQPWDGDNCHEPIAVAWGCAPLNSDKGWAFLQTMMNNVPLSALPKKARGNPNGAAGILLGHTISHEAGHLYGICHPGPPACVSPFTANSGIMWSPSLQNRLTAGWDAPSQKGLEKALGLKP